MSDLEQFLSLVESHSHLATFVGPRDEELVVSAEAALRVVFPPTFRRFVSQLGAGDIAGQEFYGVTRDEFLNSAIPNGIWLTLKAREEWGLPTSIIVVGFDGGDGYYVLDTARARDGLEPPVEIWRPGISTEGDELERVAGDFGAFAIAAVVDSLGDH